MTADLYRVVRIAGAQVVSASAPLPDLEAAEALAARWRVIGQRYSRVEVQQATWRARP